MARSARADKGFRRRGFAEHGQLRECAPVLVFRRGVNRVREEQRRGSDRVRLAGRSRDAVPKLREDFISIFDGTATTTDRLASAVFTQKRRRHPIDRKRKTY